MPYTASQPVLSERAARLKPSATFAVNDRVRALRAAGRDIIAFGVGEPDFDTPESIRRVAINAIETGMTRYQPVPGPLETRTVIAEKLHRENGIRCEPGDIVITVGAKHAIYLLLQALVDPGREVVVPTPAWVSYEPMIGLAGGEIVEVPGAVENDFRITPAQLEAALTERTAVVMLNSPSNPCGTMYTPEELRAFADVLASHPQVCVISDEIYEKLVFGGIEHFSIGSVESIADRVMTVNGLSKAYAMTGWRLGYVCAPSGVARALARLQGQMTSHATAFCYPAINEALTNVAEAVERMRATFARRAELMHGHLARMPGIVCPRPTGAFYAFPDISAHFGRKTAAGGTIESALDFATALLEETGVAIVPGEDFGDCAKTHVRLGFACSEAQIEEGCRRMADWLAAPA